MDGIPCVVDGTFALAGHHPLAVAFSLHVQESSCALSFAEQVDAHGESGSAFADSSAYIDNSCLASDLILLRDSC